MVKNVQASTEHSRKQDALGTISAMFWLVKSVLAMVTLTLC